MKILITGGCGFVGSNLAIKMKQKYPLSVITCLDNLKRRGSELNIKRLYENNVKFIHGDIRCKEDFEGLEFDLMIECSAEPSVMAGVNSSPQYLLNTNLVGTINCLESVRRNKAKIIFLSTSRVYPIDKINDMKYNKTKTRFDNIHCHGINETFPIDGPRSLYGTTKLASELLIQEYIDTYNIQAIINRCGVIAGPWQMGKTDQGVMALWVLHHMLKKPLTYIGYNGSGFQVRDFVHIDDIFDLIDIQIEKFHMCNGETFCVGGGIANSFSLMELTQMCEEVVQHKIKMYKDIKTRENDLIWYITDYAKAYSTLDWQPKKNLKQTVKDIYDWLFEYKNKLKGVLW